MPVVEIPGVGNVEFPDSMSSEEIGTAAQKLIAEQGQAAPESSGGLSDIPYVSEAAGMAKKAALPLAGGAAGLYAGGAVAGPMGAVVGESIGGGLGEVANQAFGINEPSLAEIGLAMAAGPVMRGVVGGLKTVGGAVLKAAGGRQAIAEIAEGLTQKLFAPVITSEDLFAQAASKGNITVPATKTAQAITDTLRAEAKRAPTAVKESIEKALGPLQQFYQPMPGVSSAHSAADLAVEAKRLRSMSSDAFKSGNNDLGHTLSNVRNAIFDDAAKSGVPEMREAVKAYRREAAVEELQSVIRNANPLKAYKDLQQKNALFRNVFSDSEQEQISGILKKMATVSPSGFSGVMGRGISTVAGQQAGGVMGGIAGFIAPEIAGGIIATKAGRNMMEKLLAGNTWDAPKAAALAQFFRAQRAEDAQTGNIAAQVKSALKDPNTSIDHKIEQAMFRAALIGANTGGMAEDIKSSVKRY